MTVHSIPDEIREFIVRHIHSIAQLEALLLFQDNAGGFSLEECASRLYISARECEAALQPLIAAEFIRASEGRYVFEPADECIRRRVKELAEVYRRQLISVTNLIHSRQDGVQDFADAFRVRNKS